MLDEAWGKGPPRPPSAAAAVAGPALTQIAPLAAGQGRAEGPAPSPYQFSKKIEQAVEQYVRPMLRQDGGDIEIVDIKDMLVYCSLTGACKGCIAAQQTLRMLVEQTLKDMVDQRIRVVQV